MLDGAHTRRTAPSRLTPLLKASSIAMTVCGGGVVPDCRRA
jgi:hypothetical protein